MISRNKDSFIFFLNCDLSTAGIIRCHSHEFKETEFNNNK